MPLRRRGKTLTHSRFLNTNSPVVLDGGGSMRATNKQSGEIPVSRRPNYVLKGEVESPGVHKKSIPVPDLVKICEAIQTAVHRQAEVMQRPSAQTLRRGPITASAQQECTLELFGITSGRSGTPNHSNIYP